LTKILTNYQSRWVTKIETKSGVTISYQLQEQDEPLSQQDFPTLPYNPERLGLLRF